MQSSRGRTTSGRTFRVQLDVPRALVVLLLLASFAEVRSLMQCSSNTDCDYAGCDRCGACDNGLGYNCFGGPGICGPCYNPDGPNGPCSTKETCAVARDFCLEGWYLNPGYCPERPCLPGTFNDVSGCVSGGLGRGGGTDCSCNDCPAGKYSPAVGATHCSSCPAHSDSPPASIAVTQCACMSPYSGPGGGPCTVCDTGKYIVGVGVYAFIPLCLYDLLLLYS